MSTDDTLPVLPPAPGPDGRPHIYVINSDPDFLNLIRMLLEDARVHVTVEQLRPNVEVSLDNLRSARPDLLILDVIPYRHEAAVLLEHMERDDDLKRLPVLVASTTASIAEQLADAHPDIVRDVLPKPFDLDAFYATLSTLVVGIVVP
jgi:DNA-binding NtrC family response regulator